MALAASPVNERKRVKVYELRENDWFDRGTGFCSVHTITDEGRIHVESEDEPDRSLLNVNVKKDDNYQKQQDTLIVWTDPDGVDMALSFQEAEGCGIVWSTITEMQGRLDGPDVGMVTHVILPQPELSHLEDIESVVRSAGTTQQGRDALAKMVLSDNYINRLTALVEDAEDLEDLPDLHRLCTIMKTLILFNDTQIIEHIVQDDVILGAVGALEYDPDFPHHKANHRQYLSDNSKFKEVVEIQDNEIRKKIHFTYRLQYLKDVALARILDDPSFSLFNSLIYFHQIDIVQHIATNAAFLKELFALINAMDTPAQKKKDAVSFIQQSCAVAKNLQAPCRASLYHNFISSGLFSTITFALQHRDPSVRVAGTDILVAVIDHDVLMMRNSIYKSIHDKTKPMTDTLIDLLLVETDLGVKSQVADAIKVLLDANTNAPPGDRPLGADNGFHAKMRSNAANTTQNDAFLATFFDQSAKKLFQPLKDLEKHQALTNLSIHEVSLYSHLVEILCFFVRQHSYRSKYFILHESLALRIAQLMECPEKHLKLTAIKFFKTCITLQDEHHNRQLVANRLFEPILNIVYETMPRDNLLNSACLDIFEFIRKEGIKAIIVHLVETYRERLEAITYVDVFQGILLRYEHYMNPNAPTPRVNNGEPDSSFMTSDADTPTTRHVTINGGGLRWQGLRDADAEEDAYFNADDNDEDEDELSKDHVLPNGTGPVPRPLVDYGDDDDEEAEEEWEEDGVIIETPPRKEKPTDLDPPILSSSPDPMTPGDKTSSSTAPSSTSPTTGPQPPPSIAEKRRREEDEEDELGKLSANSAKRRQSSNNLSALRSNASSNAESWVSAEAEEVGSPRGDESITAEDPASPSSSPPPPSSQVDSDKGTPRQQVLRRKRAFSQQHGAGGSSLGSKKIAISLGTSSVVGGQAKTDTETDDVGEKESSEAGGGEDR